jgi:hypothetical protein
MKLLADENFPAPVIAALRQRRRKLMPMMPPRPPMRSRSTLPRPFQLRTRPDQVDGRLLRDPRHAISHAFSR